MLILASLSRRVPIEPVYQGRNSLVFAAVLKITALLTISPARCDFPAPRGLSCCSDRPSLNHRNTLPDPMTEMFGDMFQ